VTTLPSKPLFEKYRPSTWAEVVGQESAVQRVTALRDRSGLGSRAFWITGASGTGKTTIARLISAEVADPFCTIEVDAGAVTPDFIRDAERSASMYGMWAKTGRVWIVNEAHGLRGQTIRALEVLLEPIPAHCVWIFTTTKTGEAKLFEGCEDPGPLLSRCIRLDLSSDVETDFAARLARIAKAEKLDAGLNGSLRLRCVELIRRHRGNMRAAIQAIDAQELSQPIPIVAVAEVIPPRVANPVSTNRSEIARKAACLGWARRRLAGKAA
jgi:replication-associated recombination protein RarA